MMLCTAIDQPRWLDLIYKMAKLPFWGRGKKGDGPPEILSTPPEKPKKPTKKPEGEKGSDDNNDRLKDVKKGCDLDTVKDENEKTYDTIGTDNDEYIESREARRATSSGPQLFSLLVDHSASMEDGKKAQEATQVLKEVIQYAKSINSIDQTGTKTYFCTQVILFAEKFEDSTNGMKRPPDALKPSHAFSVRASNNLEERARLGNLTDYQAPLAHVYKTLKGKEGMTIPRLKAGMPAPIVLFITDGMPNLPRGKAEREARKEADKIKSLILPEVKCYHPTYEEISYPEEQVRIITIGLGEKEEFNPELLRELCTVVPYKGKELSLYLHCPRAEDLKKIGTQIVGTVTRADQADAPNNTLEDVIYSLQKSLGK